MDAGDDGMHQERGVTAGLVLLVALLLTCMVLALITVRTGVRFSTIRPANSITLTLSGSPMLLGE